MKFGNSPAKGHMACPAEPCPVCLSERTALFMRLDAREYWRCRHCLATFVDPAHLPSPESERQRYLQHNNDPQDPRYRAFLAQLAQPLLNKLKPGRQGLDYGCGPGPALAEMLAEAGHRVRLYDPFFQPDTAPLAQTYDFVTCTEVVEHFHFPAREFARFDSLLRPDGWLGIMTSFQTDDAQFANWHYRRDPTHVVFYRPQTFLQLAKGFGWHCEMPARNVVLMHKNPAPVSASPAASSGGGAEIPRPCAGGE